MKYILSFFLLFSVLSLNSFSAKSYNKVEVQLSDGCISEDSLRTDTAVTSTTDSIPLPDRMRELLKNDIFERTQVGLYVYDLTADTLVFAYNEKQCMRPASNQKMLTAITALHDLGTDYQLRTSLYVDSLVTENDSEIQSKYSACIYIKAGFDPLFAAEDMRAFADSIKSNGIDTIALPICLDLSMKDDKRMGWGWCWDDKLTALTPLLFNEKDCFVDQLWQTLREEGIVWDGAIEERKVPYKARLICSRQHTIDQVLLPMMKESDNMMAEAIFYQLAAKSGQPHAGRKQAVKHYNSLIRTLGLDPSHFQVADGSGLSLYNYATPELLGKALRYAYAHNEIYRHLLPSLPVAACDGTLRKRMQSSKAAFNVHAKTGTVEGVSTLSGYCTAANGNTLCFAIMNQGLRHLSTGRNFQDRICKALCR